MTFFGRAFGQTAANPGQQVSKVSIFVIIFFFSFNFFVGVWRGGDYPSHCVFINNKISSVKGTRARRESREKTHASLLAERTYYCSNRSSVLKIIILFKSSRKKTPSPGQS